MTARGARWADSRGMTQPKANTSTTASDTAANATSQPATGEGMPAKSPREQRSRPGRQDTLKDGAVESSLELPHERDQAADMTSSEPSADVAQASRDLKQGRKDTSKGPEMDTAYQKQKG